jgi:mannose-6-phosphate isomerase-like protein (cupin superfamily)
MRDSRTRPDPRPGDELEEAATRSRLRFLRTRAEGDVRMELTAPAGWTAGPLHVHPRTVERLTVLDGDLEARVGGARRHVASGGVLVVPRCTPHTVAARTAVRLLVEFSPPLRVDRLFYEMYGGGPQRHPSRRVPAVVRAWLESRGYDQEIRYLWPRRLGAGVVVLAVVTTAAARLRSAARRSAAHARARAPHAAV